MWVVGVANAEISELLGTNLAGHNNPNLAVGCKDVAAEYLVGGNKALGPDQGVHGSGRGSQDGGSNCAEVLLGEMLPAPLLLLVLTSVSLLVLALLALGVPSVVALASNG